MATQRGKENKEMRETKKRRSTETHSKPYPPIFHRLAVRGLLRSFLRLSLPLFSLAPVSTRPPNPKVAARSAPHCLIYRTRMAVGPIGSRVMTVGIPRYDALQARVGFWWWTGLSVRVGLFHNHVRPFMQSERRCLLV